MADHPQPGRERVLEVLDHPEPPALIEADRDRLADDRLGEQQVELEVNRDVE
jgi:hypothetical protein